MKYIKTFERKHEYKENEDVVLIYLTPYQLKKYNLKEKDEIGKIYKITMYDSYDYAIGIHGDDVWVRPYQIRKPTELEIVANKYNL